MGAAVTGGVGVGVFNGFEVIDQMLELNRTVEPNPGGRGRLRPGEGGL